MNNKNNNILKKNAFSKIFKQYERQFYSLFYLWMINLKNNTIKKNALIHSKHTTQNNFNSMNVYA